ncbi:cleavage and polyadenylation specificity factor subunit 6-like [Homarus americanus]|uniref:cleavage and polyadenylation specificity factor subunit 6-like n=1 Tax=Homarus americanus TaxID=6706 RepID=UPI001C46BDBE|nr:cleavage and polyadenylation specificity factor subunit 6-like [Homarus americanus]
MPVMAAHNPQDLHELIAAHRSQCAGGVGAGECGQVSAPQPDPYRFEYHAAQLEKFLQEYRCLQEQLIHMKQSYEAQHHRGSEPRLECCPEGLGAVGGPAPPPHVAGIPLHVGAPPPPVEILPPPVEILPPPMGAVPPLGAPSPPPSSSSTRPTASSSKSSSKGPTMSYSGGDINPTVTHSPNNHRLQHHQNPSSQS